MAHPSLPPSLAVAAGHRRGLPQAGPGRARAPRRLRPGPIGGTPAGKGKGTVVRAHQPVVCGRARPAGKPGCAHPGAGGGAGRAQAEGGDARAAEGGRKSRGQGGGIGERATMR
eukprot:scaffold25024_cov101-Isochrysis_galbana.AAC.1